MSLPLPPIFDQFPPEVQQWIRDRLYAPLPELYDLLKRCGIIPPDDPDPFGRDFEPAYQCESVTAHRGELQIIGVYTNPSASISGMWGFFLSAAIRLVYSLRHAREGFYGHLFLRRGQDIWEATSAGWVQGQLDYYCTPRWVCEAYFVPTTQEQQSEIIAQAQAFTQPSVPYAWLDDLRILLATIPGVDLSFLDQGDSALMCSRGVAACYLAGGVDLPKSAGRTTWDFEPSDIRRVYDAGDAIYRGVLTWPG